ncbi:MAG: hypothetical protein JJU02_04730 [Cryomorphaceae bacterium]|nr:hypothetical protein [Cryomorphaceae bacterium]
MAKAIIILLSVLTLASCSDKDKITIVETHVDGAKRIVYYYPDQTDTTYYERQFYYPNGQLGSKGYVQNGQLTGPWFWWYENGNPEAHSTYINGKEKDSILCYYESGQISRKLFLIDTSKNKWLTTDYYENGQKRIETFTVGQDRIIDSFWREWNEEGILIREGQMDSAKKVGTWKILGENDALISVDMDGTGFIKFNE